VTWEWVLQGDFDGSELERWIPGEILADDRVRAEAVGHFGVSTARNLGLLRCRAELVQTLDQDDLLLPGALAAAVAALRADEELALCCGEGYHLMPDGSLEPRPPQKRVLEPGRIEPGEIEARWRSGKPHGMIIPGAMWRKRYLFAYGGWAALPAWEDFGIVFPVAQRHPVAFIGRDTLHHRNHPSQASRGENRAALVEAQRPFLFNRLDAMREVLRPPAGDGQDD